MAVTDKWVDKSAQPNTQGKYPLLPKEARRGLRWRADWTAPDGKRKRKDFATKAEAEEHHGLMVAQARRGNYVDPKLSGKITVAKLNKEFSERMATRGFRAGKGPASAKTQDNYRRQYENYIHPRWGDTPLSGVSYDATAEWIATLEGRHNGGPSGKPAGEATRRAVAAAFGRLMNHAVRLKYLASNPAKDPVGSADYVPQANTKRKHVYLTMEQLLTLASNAGDYEDMVLLAGLCGLRWGEVAALQAQDVMLGTQPSMAVCRSYSELPKAQGGLVETPPKSGEERLVPIPRQLATRLASHLEGKAPTARVFSSRRGFILRNSLFTRRYYTPAIQATAKVMGGAFARPTFHDLRHTAVSLAIKAGANIKVVQQIAGHASATLTLDTYAGLFTDDLHDSARRLDEVLSQTLQNSSSLSRHWTTLDTNNQADSSSDS